MLEGMEAFLLGPGDVRGRRLLDLASGEGGIARLAQGAGGRVI